jgi:hypothetical protein
MIMRLLIIVLFCLNTSCHTEYSARPKKYFEGKVVYQVFIQPKQPGIDTATLRSLVGHSSVFYFKEGNYKQLYDTWGMKEELYLKAENRSYFKLEGNDTLYWRSMAEAPKKITSSEINRKKGTVLNIICDELVVNYPDETRRFYYNSDTLSIDPVWLGKYAFSDKNFTSEKMRSLFLKCELDYPEFTVSITAVSIEPGKLDDAMFRLPPNAVLKEKK